MLYLADNLAYIPYTVLDEPLFVIHHIDIQISVSGSNLLQTFKEVRMQNLFFLKVLLFHFGIILTFYAKILAWKIESWNFLLISLDKKNFSRQTLYHRGNLNYVYLTNDFVLTVFEASSFLWATI